MAWLNEHDSKTLLSEYGLPVPAGRRVLSPEQTRRAAEELGPPVFVKALGPEKDRASRGGVLRATSVREAELAYQRVTGALGVQVARVEEECRADEWWYLALGVLPGKALPEVLFSRDGGTGVEAKSSNLASLTIDPIIGLQPFHSRHLAAHGDDGLPRSHQEALHRTLETCYRAMKALDASLVELNPLGIDRTGTAVAVDARLVVDDYSLFRQERIRSMLETEADSSLVDELRELGIEYVPYNGNIGIVGLGAGLTMHIADWLKEEGGSPAFFFDATVAAVRDWGAMFRGALPTRFAEAIRRGLSLVKDQLSVLLVNFTSGGTPVDALSRALLQALAEEEWSLPFVIHVGGNRSADAKDFLVAAGHAPSETLGEAVRAAVNLEKGLP